MTNPIESLPLKIAQQVDELCDRFEDGWSADHQFQIEQFLREVNPDVQPALLAALLPIELELMEKQGQEPDIESYVSRFPQFADVIAAVTAEFDADAERESGSKTYQTGAAETFVSNPGTGEPEREVTGNSPPTIMRGNVDSQTSINPLGPAEESASTIEGDFGRYRVIKTLGQGAMGAVYLALDTQLDRQVALKIPKFTEDPDGEMLARFYREARAAAMLRSPNICPVFDVGDIDGQHYITMAYIEGRPLKDFTSSKKRHSTKQIAVTIRKLAMGLSEAHAAGVVHRDLKPANIMVDRKNEPVVMDFGLARRNAASEVEVTHTGAILGTPAYMSPEQVDGEQAEIGPQTDVYSLGVIMYQLLTGKMPFEGTLMSILKQIAVDEPKPPSELRSSIDPKIEGICLKMMAKDRAARYQSMDEVARELSDYLKNPPTKSKSKTVVTDSRAQKSVADDSIQVGEESNPVLKSALPETKQMSKPVAGKPARVVATGQRSSQFRKIAIAVGVLAACGLVYAAITLFLRVGKVDVKVVIDDPSISVRFEEGGVVKFEGSGEPIRLSPGEQKFVIERDGLRAVADEFHVTKDGKNILHVSLVDGKVAVVKNGEKPAAIANASTESSGEENPARVKPAVTFPIRHYALQFSKDDRVELPEFDIDYDKPFTVEFWVKVEDAEGRKGYVTPFNLKSLAIHHNLGEKRWQAMIAARGDFPVSRPGYRSFKSNSVVQTGQWRHLAICWQNERFTFFVNGVEQKQSDFVRDAIKKGDEASLGINLIGQMHEFHVSSACRYVKDFVPAEQFDADEHTTVLYHFDEGVGDVLKDSSGNDHHGKIVGATWESLDNGPSEQIADLATTDWPLKPTDPADIRWAHEKLNADVTLRFGPDDNRRIRAGSRLPDVKGGTLVGLRIPQSSVVSGIDDLKRIAGFADLQSLAFEDNQHAYVGDKGELMSLAPLQKLRSLNITGIRDAAINSEALLRKLPQLVSLRLPYPVADEWAAEASTKKSIVSISGYRTRLTDQGLGHLKKMTWLEYLDLESALVRPAAIEQFAAAVPSCRIRVDHQKYIEPRQPAGPSKQGAAPPPAVAPFDAAQAKVHQQEWANYLGLPVEKEVQLPGAAKMVFLLIPPGEFKMGASDEEQKRYLAMAEAVKDGWATGNIPKEGPQHLVRITQPFYLAKFETTAPQWQGISSADAGTSKAGNPLKAADGVSWNDIQPVLGKLNEAAAEPGVSFILPTEAQWEYACRAGTTTPFHFGGSDEAAAKSFWALQNSKDAVQPVGRFPANAWGLFDMHGNCHEWCADNRGQYSSETATDPINENTSGSRVFRGGSIHDQIWSCRSAFRGSRPPSWSRPGHGFRVAMTINTGKLQQSRTSTGDADRIAAEWVLSTTAGEITIESGTITKAADLPSKPFQVRTIRLSNLRTVSIDDFARLQGLQHIESLWFHNVHVGDDVMQYLVPLKSLTLLSLNQCKLTDRSLPEFAKLPNLVHLRIGGSEITNAGLESLKPLSQLTDLWLNHTKITDDGLIHLSGLSELKSLHLHANDLTDDGLVHLSRLKSLKALGLNATKVTADGVVQLRKTLPKCKVEFGSPK